MTFKKVAVIFAIIAIGVLLGTCYWYNLPPGPDYEPNEVFEPPPETSGGGIETPITTDGVSIFHNSQPPYYSKTYGEQVHLINNKDATDPTWQQLMSFLIADRTDQKAYSVFLFPCGAFAEEVHNNAEAAGIRTAWVGIDFEGEEIGHALNAFETTDKGLVYIDCTGDDPSLIHEIHFPGEIVYGDTDSWDKVAYVELEQELGFINLEVATTSAYTYYEQYKQRLQTFEVALEDYNQRLEDYNQEVAAYNQALGGRQYLEEPEYSQFMEWANNLDSMLVELEALEAELDREGNSLGAFWEPFGVVVNVEIYW